MYHLQHQVAGPSPVKEHVGAKLMGGLAQSLIISQCARVSSFILPTSHVMIGQNPPTKMTHRYTHHDESSCTVKPELRCINSRQFRWKIGGHRCHGFGTHHQPTSIAIVNDMCSNNAMESLQPRASFWCRRPVTYVLPIAIDPIASAGFHTKRNYSSTTRVSHGPCFSSQPIFRPCGSM